ncbi:class I SAM-dependent methyltransferase [Sedimentitalea todarodis]|uniref:SAM-dependent methyltransferase n=1 Tax=Sedimentitalea todarodis TaxID=1631240 RepID=A0ABU3VAB9_9RHOB|nr:SAM-dependent methyltransferase [Sedimentitalea todarodis]MDU9003123.1 SAM-dependent methyltransferase [Sedimentitalea todarodis]
MNLKEQILSRIRADGPISIASYMNDCLLHPTLGYYATRDPLGATGDFITAPEISQMFGELIGLSLAQAWLDQGNPAPFTFGELGPGRGTLMADLLRATRAVPGFHAAAQIALVELSPPLRAAQAKALQTYDPTWHDDVDTLPDQPLFLIANEFFDALPIRQFIRESTGWRERRVGAQSGDLIIGLTDPAAYPALDHRLTDTKDGDLVEVCPAATPIVTALSQRIARHGGAALIVDYGDWRSLGDTLQALRAHQTADILSTPGEADLTAHVDFETLATAATAAGCAHSRLTTQGVFLERLGITTRAQTLARSLSGNAQENLVTAHRRLTHPTEMGNLFKTLGLYPATAAPPPGLEP